MNLSVKRFFEQYGVILEMNDWKSHFLAGTKGVKKTEPVILDYVESLLDSVYEDKSKVKTNRLAPWLVSQVSEIGVLNIGTDDRKKFLTIIEWVKEVGGEGNIPKMKLQQAYEFASTALEKRGKFKAQDEKKKEEIPVAEIPETADEKAGLIKRVWVVPDNSGRMWVKVLKSTWLDKQCEAGRQYGIGCQTGGGWAGFYLYTLIGPPKGMPQGIKSTIVSMAVNPKTKAIRELKQEDNQQPGIQATSGGWNDVAEQVINFIAFSQEARTHIDKFYTYNQDEPTVRKDSGHNPYNGGAGALWSIMEKNPELLNRLVTARPSMKEDNKNIILSHHKFGHKWYESFGIDVEKYALDNPVKFIENLENYEYLGSELWKIIEKLNIEEIAAKHPKLVISKIDKLLGNLSVETFKKLLNTINLPKYIETSTDQFKNLVKMMSAAKNPKYKELMVEIVSNNITTIMQSSGGGIKGLYDFLDFVSLPKMHRFSRKDTDGQIYAFKTVTTVDRVTGDRTITEEEFPLRDDLAIFPQKERRKLIEKNKELIKSLYEGTDEEKEIKYIRILFRETNPQDVERTLKAEKDKFIKYYDKHPSSATGYPGILEFYSVLSKGKPGHTSVSHTKEGATKIYFKMDLADLRNRDVQRKLLVYYYQKSDATNPTAKKYGAAEDMLFLFDFSGESKEALIDMVKKEFSPKQVVGNNTTSADYIVFMNMMSKFLDKPQLRAFVETYKDEIINSGMMGNETYKDMLKRYSDRGYNVKVGDMVEYNKRMTDTYSSEDDDKIYLTRGLKYRVTDVADDVTIKNAKIKVLDDRKADKKESWHSAGDFNLKIVSLQESVRKYIQNKMLENYTKKLMEHKEKKPNYSAVVLDEKSRSKLFEKFTIPEGWSKIAHHMTMNMGSLSDKSLIGKEFNMRVTAIAGNDKVIAIQVETNAPSNNEIKHVTLAVNKEAGGKPAMSKVLTNWEPVKAPFFIKGIVEEVRS